MKLSVLSVACALTLGLVGCGSDSEPTKNDSGILPDSAVNKDAPIQPQDTALGPDTALPAPDVPIGDAALPKLNQRA